MFKRLSLALVLATATACPGQALDLNDMTDADRAAFGVAVRTYLMENPDVLVEVIDELNAQRAAQQAQGDVALIAAYSGQIFDDGYSYVGGNPDGDVTMVEFLDYRCGFCKKAHPDIAQLLQSDGNIRYIIKEFPILGDESTLAARFAMAVRASADDAVYLAVHNALMEENGHITEGFLRRLARAHDLDTDAIMDGMDDPAIDGAIQANYQLAKTLGITGTPGFVMGDTMLRGYAPLGAMQQMIAEVRRR